MIDLQAKCTCKASPPSSSSTSGCTVHYRQHCKGNKAAWCEQNIKVHVTIHLQAACRAAGSEKETVMTCSLCSVCCSIDASKPAAPAMTLLSADHLKSAPYAVFRPDLCGSLYASSGSRQALTCPHAAQRMYRRLVTCRRDWHAAQEPWHQHSSSSLQHLTADTFRLPVLQ